ncbi:site-specific DNA-methyltransferase [Phocaeicola coprocola]|jgi:adenine-specific DNA-methyltransferase|uniref:site-specific DNA-methyltransferase n=1 Tax=Phocaeicola coprocola TaxID=310298 RepID=UPI0022E8178F|nr:site-specific DNA-methyltransferase [Phocaeicola coprocola]
MKPNKLELNSVDGTQLNLEALYQIAPSCFTEVKDDKTGELRRVVNFTALRQLLGDNAVEDTDEMYQFTWPGKQEARREVARPTTKTLRPVVEDSVDWDNTQNLYIEGDNLEVLKLLQKSYMGKVKMIYIDPPYNTGNDFVYDDDFAASQDDYDLFAGNIDELGNRYRKNTETNGRFHSDWCSMMYSRLMVARSLLTEDGVIFISIDDNEQKNLKNICDEIYGSTNFLAQVIWERAFSPINLMKHFSPSHDYILVYAKNGENAVCNGIKRSEEANDRYSNPDNDPRGVWSSSDISVGPAIQENVYTITTPSGREVEPPAGRSWSLSRKAFRERLQDNRIWFGPDGNGVPRIKRFLSELRKTGVTPMTIWKHTEVDHSQGATQKLAKLFDGKKYFDYPKPVTLIQRCISLYSNKDSLILDFFSGSSTTAHAVMQLNAEDGGKRKYIMVQLPEETPEDSEARKAGYNTIPEIAKERIRRAGKKIKEESPLTTQNLDTGFRVFRLADSNFEEVKKAPEEYDQSQLDLFLNNVKSDRTDLDLLFGAMLSWGVQLSLPMTSEEVDGKMIYSVNDGDLVACFADDITENIVKAMADKQPLRVLFRDSCFARDDAKINVFETLKQLLDWSEEEAIKNIKVI